MIHRYFVVCLVDVWQRNFEPVREYSHLKEEALDRTMWRNRFGGGFGPVVRQNTELMNVTQNIPIIMTEN